MPLRQAVGRVLAEDIRSPLALPPWDNASMDGYAVRSADVGSASASSPVRLTVVGTIAAGSPSAHVLAQGQAMRIMTGAPVPTGADTVVRVEDTDAGTSHVHILASRDVLKNVRPRGEDLAPGQLALARGDQLYPGHVGLLASIGCADVPVVRRPRVAVLASGDELVEVERFREVTDGGSGKIVSSNSYSLEAAVEQAGALPLSLGFVRDDPTALRDRLREVDCDFLLTSGGVSVGEFDFTRSVLAELGATERFWRVRIRPGAPVGFGILRGIPWLGLPGNPVSTLVTFELFARPAIRKMSGQSRLFRRPVRVRLGENVDVSGSLTHFLRADVQHHPNGDVIARLTGPQGSGLLSSMARANALLVIPADRPHLKAGELVDALFLRDDLSHVERAPLP